MLMRNFQRLLRLPRITRARVDHHAFALQHQQPQPAPGRNLGEIQDRRLLFEDRRLAQDHTRSAARFQAANTSGQHHNRRIGLVGNTQRLRCEDKSS